MPGRVPGKCPAIPLAVTLVLPTLVLWHAGRLCSSTTTCSPDYARVLSGAQPSFVGSKEDRDREGTSGAAEKLAPVRQGLLCCKTLSRHQQDFGLGDPHTGMASLRLLFRHGAEMVGTGILCPALRHEHLPVFPAPCLSFPSPSWDFSNYRHSRQAWRGDQVTSPSPQPWSPEGTLLAAAPPGETIKRQEGRASIPEKTAREGCATSAAGHPFPPHGVFLASTKLAMMTVPIWNGHRH